MNYSKCKFRLMSVEYLGHVVSSKGIQAAPGKVQAVLDAPVPKDLTQLWAFLGLINYYGKFLPNLSNFLHPLHNLLRKEQKWEWTSACNKAFKEAKSALASAKVLVYYDPSLPVRLS